ncbi:MAG: G8 domain-containing protein [Crocosphaera sp.]|nr:G8 domain-containing protein [Crocosphaera sp.]
MDAHIHAPFLDIVPHSKATHIAVNNGSWFDPKTWQDGVIPNDNADVVIAQGVEVFYDKESNARIHTIRVDGSLEFSHNKNTQLIVDYIAVSNTGTLEIGTENNPLQAQANIIFAPVDPNNPEIDTNWDPHQLSRGLVAGNGAKVSIFGEEKTGYVTLADNHLSGATKLTFSEPVPTDWEVGDTIVLTGTAWDKNGSHEDNSVTQDEVLTIESIKGNTITFRHNDVNGNALRFDHTTPKGFDLDIYVANLTRNVIFESEGGNDVPPSQRGHTMFMDHDTKIYNAGFYGLGRTNKDLFIDDPQFDSKGKLIPGTGTNPRARYPIHFHEILEHHMDMDMNMDMDTAEVNGNAIWNTPGWALSVHSSRADVTNNVSFDAVGSHFVTEDGDEQATFRNNIAIKAAGSITDPDANLINPRDIRGQLNDFGSSGIGFWLDTSYSVAAFENNIATGMADAGIIVYGQNDLDSGPLISVSNLPDDLQHIAGTATEIHAYKVPLRNFTNNSVYNSEGGVEIRGVQRDDSGFDFNKVGHDEQSILEGLKIWGVQKFGVANHYAAHINVKNALIVGDTNNPIPLFGGPDQAQGIGIFSDKNARAMTYENVHVEGFTIGATLPQTGRQGYDSESPFSHSSLIGGEFTNNTYNLHAAPGREGRAPSNPYLSPLLTNPSLGIYFEIQGNPIFEVPSDNLSPVADFTFESIGGLSIAFDASTSYDPDYFPGWTDTHNDLYTAGDNTIASFAWDFDGDGTIDDFGRYSTYVYDTPGIYDATLIVYDIQGAATRQSVTINVENNPYSNLLNNGDFSQPLLGGYGYASFKWNNLSDSENLSDEVNPEGWYINDNTYWNWDQTNGWAFVDSTGGYGAKGMSQVIYDQTARRGLQTVSFDARNIGSNTLRLEVLGINGRFKLPNQGGASVTNLNNTVPFEAVTLLDTGNVANNQFDWTTFTFDNVDFGEGYEFIGVRISTNGVDSNEFLAVDNIFIGDSAETIDNSNNSPIALNDTAQVNENESVVIDVLANDSDPDGDFIFVSNINQPSHGQVLDNGNGTLTYTPNTNFSGSDSFVYTVADLNGQTDTATVNLKVDAVDNPSPTNILSFNDYIIESYSNQDKNPKTVIEDNGSSLKIIGNSWKKIAMPYEVTANTVLEFDFFSSQQGEINGIAFDNDNNQDTNSNQLFKLFGTQGFGDQTFNNYQDSVGQWKHYRIEVGQFYTGQMNELVFINDHDVSNPTAESIFSNIQVYEETPVPSNSVPFDSQIPEPPPNSNDPITEVTTITGTKGEDILEGTNGDDVIYGRGGKDILTGSAGDDILKGGAGKDTLRGGSGSDVLTGGKGNDILRGGSGNDIFNFTANEGRDRIRDFESGDTILLQNIDPQSLELIEQNGNTFLDLGNNQGIKLLGISPDALNINILSGVIELTL